jgi:hypothetical protein
MTTTKSKKTANHKGKADKKEEKKKPAEPIINEPSVKTPVEPVATLSTDEITLNEHPLGETKYN